MAGGPRRCMDLLLWGVQVLGEREQREVLKASATNNMLAHDENVGGPPTGESMDDRKFLRQLSPDFKDVAAATLLSCGLGGFECTTIPAQHIRCCRVDCDDCTVPTVFALVVTCCCCCANWTGFASVTHKRYDVPANFRGWA